MKKRFKNVKKEKGRRIQAQEAPEPSYESETPKFCLYHLNPNSKYCLSKCSKDDKASFATKIRLISKSTWIQLRMADKYGIGFEPIKDKRVKKLLPKNVSEDTTVLAFRYHKKKPMLGYRKKDIFHIIAFDHDFSAYDHG